MFSPDTLDKRITRVYSWHPPCGVNRSSSEEARSMSDSVASSEDQEPLPKRLKLSNSGARAEDEAAGGGARPEETPSIMLGGLVCKFLKEADVGITEYVSSQPGFFAILKQRYSDFLVREIASSGEVVKLTSLAPPPPVAVGDGEGAELTDVFSSTDIERLQKLSSGNGSMKGSNKDVIEIKAAREKERRTAMHHLLKTHFPSLASQTVEVAAASGSSREEEEEEGEERVIQVWHRRGSADKRRPQWPGGKKKYCRFTLYKENRDAVDVINYLARQLGVRSSVFHSAGLKDRRAVTTQHYTAFKVKVESLLNLNESLANVLIGDPVYVSEPLKLGQLTGNRFTIILRSVSCDDHVIQEKMTSLREKGFINYFGMQRFGTSTIPTYHIGRCILHSDWKGAVEAVLAPRPGESEDLTTARQFFVSTRDAQGALDRLPRGRPLERAVLKGLAERKGLNDYLGALKRIPYSSRLMYVHSYQSLVWNRVASHRIRRHSLRPIPGDLVPGNGNGPQAITEETLNQYTIHDVLLPLPGYDISLPQNDVREKYESLLAEDKLTFQQLNHKVRDFTLHGSYRHIVVRPKDIEWDVLRYDDVTAPLVVTDRDELENKPPPESVEGGQQKALRMSFSLPTASYATMAVRELLKMETSSHYQTQLNPPLPISAPNSAS